MYLYSNTTKVKIDKQLSILSQQILQDDINEGEILNPTLTLTNLLLQTYSYKPTLIIIIMDDIVI